jgi:hypothetical protein
VKAGMLQNRHVPLNASWVDEIRPAVPKRRN